MPPTVGVVMVCVLFARVQRRAVVEQLNVAGVIITNDLTTAGKDLFARYAERMSIENELDAYISGFNLDALSSRVPLNVDLDTTLTVVAGNLYRLFARNLTHYETATPDTIWRHFLDDDGTLHINDNGVGCALRLRSHQPPTHRRRLLVDQLDADPRGTIWFGFRDRDGKRR